MGALSTASFEPECLTVYLSNRCNLGCSYCYSAPKPGESEEPRHRATATLAIEHVRSAAATVAAHCLRKGRPFTLVAHGGGEPSLHPELLAEICDLTREVAAEFGLRWWGYVATNGVMPADRALWLAQTFNHIGLSCDGPEQLQNRQRPTWNNHATSAYVERSAAIFSRHASAFTVRATITAASWQRQAEIVEYAARQLRCRDIRFEAAYLQPNDGCEAVHATATFVDFVRACRRGRTGTRRQPAHVGDAAR